MKKFYQVELEKEELIFSAAHFITFGDNICESIHGHNYRLRCRVTGELNEHGYVTDFVLLARLLKEISQTLDHQVLLPQRHVSIQVEQREGEVIARFGNRRWVFPVDDCCLLPVDNTTAERIAEYIAGQLLLKTEFDRSNLTELEVAVDENEGQWGVFCQPIPTP